MVACQPVRGKARRKTARNIRGDRPPAWAHPSAAWEDGRSTVTGPRRSVSHGQPMLAVTSPGTQIDQVRQTWQRAPVGDMPIPTRQVPRQQHAIDEHNEGDQPVVMHETRISLCTEERV
jgi:hypothetical protein